MRGESRARVYAPLWHLFADMRYLAQRRIVSRRVVCRVHFGLSSPVNGRKVRFDRFGASAPLLVLLKTRVFSALGTVPNLRNLNYKIPVILGTVPDVGPTVFPLQKTVA